MHLLVAGTVWFVVVASLGAFVVHWLRGRARDPMAQARDALSDRAWDNELARDALTDVERSGASPPLSGVDATVSELRVRGGPFENPPVG